MAKLVNWFRQAVTSFLEADRESDVQLLVYGIEQGLSAFGQNFSLHTALSNFHYDDRSLAIATERVYRAAVERFWSDGVLTAGEQGVARWLAGKLELTAAEESRLNYDQARKWFGLALAEAMQDGVLDADEETRLKTIAASAGCNLPQFTRMYFQREGEAFLRTIFLACVADGHFSQSDWDYLIHATNQLGLSADQLFSAIEPHARHFVAHVLAEAKADGVFTQLEQDTLKSLLHNLRLPTDFCLHVLGEIDRVNNPPALSTRSPPRIESPSCISIEPKGRFAIDVVGESKYQDALTRLCGGKQHDSADACFLAVLYLENTNPYDNRAVRVDIHDNTVGYLSRDCARRFRRWLKRHGHTAKAAQCQANVRGGWYRGPDDEGHFGVFLDLPLREGF